MTEAGSPGGVALVTGASSGVGRAVAEDLASRGFKVYLGGRHPERLGRAAAATDGVPLAFDVTHRDQVAAARDRILETDGPPSVLVNAAGVFDMAPIAETPGEVLDRNIDVNLRGAFHVVQAFLPAMLEEGSGLIVNVGSVSGRKAFAENGAYAASKYGLRGMHEVLLEEIRGTGVRASLVEPGAVDTPIWDPMDPDSSPGLPGRSRMLRAEDVARAIAFLVTLPPHVAVPLLQIERA